MTHLSAADADVTMNRVARVVALRTRRESVVVDHFHEIGFRPGLGSDDFGAGSRCVHRVERVGKRVLLTACDYFSSVTATLTPASTG